MAHRVLAAPQHFFPGSGREPRQFEALCQFREIATPIREPRLPGTWQPESEQTGSHLILADFCRDLCTSWPGRAERMVYSNCPEKDYFRDTHDLQLTEDTG